MYRWSSTQTSLTSKGDGIVAEFTLGVNDPVAAASGDHFVSDFILRPHAGAQDILPTPFVILQVLDRLLADHAPIGHDANAIDPEATPESIHDGDQRLHVGGVAGPQLAADRSALSVQDRSHDHLLEIRPMILGVAVLAQSFPAFSLEVDRRGVEENQLEIGEEIAAVSEQIFLDSVLDATGSERRFVRLLVLGQHFAQPSHGPVEVVELKRVTAVDLIIPPPLVGSSITAGDKEAMQHGEKDGPLDVKLEAATCQ